MTVLSFWRTAIKTHRCERCGQLIQAGERYVVSSLPPGSDIGNKGWWHTASHGETRDACPAGQVNVP